MDTRVFGTVRTVWACHVLLVALTGCSSGWVFGRSEEKPVEPNIYPENYKADLLTFLRNRPTEIEKVREAYISEPVLGQFGGPESRYYACVKTEGEGNRAEKVVIFFAGRINQYVNATGERCAAAAYQPFSELPALVAQLAGKKN
jgi:hypothetical protein